MIPASAPGSATRRRVVPDLVAGLAVAAGVAGATWWLLDLSATFLVEVIVLYGAATALILSSLPRALPGPGFGPANRVTLGRLVLTLSLAGLLLHGDSLGVGARWWIIGVGTAVMVLDGFDGWVARRTGTGTSYGARFDMETDAFLMLVLSGLVWVEERAGAWVFLIGGMRYLFVAAGRLVPALRAPLFHSLRRRVVCVVQGVGLLVCLGPIIPGTMATAAAALALASLVWSFGVDTMWLLRRGEAAPGSSTSNEMAPDEAASDQTASEPRR